MSQIPPGWCRARISDLGEVRLGRQRSPDRAQGPHMRPYMRAANVTWAGLNLDDVKQMDFSPEEYETFALRRGDVLVGEASGSRLEVGKSAVWREEVPGACFQNTIIRVRPSKAILPEYLQKHLQHDALRGALAEVARGIGIHHLGAAGLAEWEIGVAPLPEQQRIAGKLDSLLSRVNACRQRLDRILAMLKRFRQSVLTAATSGELTTEWRAERRVGREEWQTTTFVSVCKEITVGFVGKMASEYRPEGVPFLRSQNVRPFRFDPRELRYISREFHQTIRKSSLAPGDVAVVRTGAPGQCCVIPKELREANCSDLVIVRPGPELDSKYAAVFINSETSQSFVKSEQVGVAQSHFNVGSMKRAPIELPSLDEQREIARRVDELLALAEQLEERVAVARRLVAGLPPAALAKAFRGELVPQDPNDERAVDLLARMRANTSSPAEPTELKPSKRTRTRESAPAPRRNRRVAQ